MIYWSCSETNSQIKRRILVCRVYHTRQRQHIVKYAQEHSVTETAIRYRVSRKTIYIRLARYDGTLSILEDRSHRPRTLPRSHTEQKFRQIRRRKNKHLTMFQEALAELGIIYHRIQIATPGHNGKAERQHRTDEARFYKHMRKYSLKDGPKELAVYQKKSNGYIKTCPGMGSPNTIVRMYQGVIF